jgi:predicted site-specific integrase-resolvase
METINKIESALEGKTFLSPYQLAKVCSDLTGRLVRPQMLYSYVKQGLIPSQKNEVGKIVVSAEDAKVWLGKFVPKHEVG